MQVGKLYKVKTHYWLCYEDKKLACANGTKAGTYHDDLESANHIAKQLKTYYGTNISILLPDDLFVPLDVEERVVKVLSSGGIGWIRYAYHAPWSYDNVVRLSKL